MDDKYRLISSDEVFINKYLDEKEIELLNDSLLESYELLDGKEEFII